MRRHLPAVLVCTLYMMHAFAQSPLPILKATSKKVSINDGGFLDKDAWNLSPKIRPDIFTADRTRKTKWVTFYTDIDSIRVKVKPGSRFDFIVLLNGKDSCYTRIASAIPQEDKHQSRVATHDTIPFTLTSHSAIQVRSVINDTDTLNLHFDVSSFDFRLTKDAILKKTKLLPSQPKVVKLQMGQMVWKNPVVLPTTFTAHDMDGRFGWNLFEGRIVEINYDKGLLVIHSQLPKALKAYNRSRLEFIRSFVCVRGKFIIRDKNYSGDFILDTGSDQSIILDSAWTAKQDFPKDLQLIRSMTLKDPRGAQYVTRVVCYPLFAINKWKVSDIPTLILGSANPVNFEINLLGNGLLKEFNTILDFKNDYVYLKPRLG